MKLVGAFSVGCELPLIKYILPYLKRGGYDKIYFLYNDTDDGSVEVLKNQNFGNEEYILIQGENTDTKYFNWELEKARIYYEILVKEKQEADTTGEEIWVQMSDFDEVIFTPYEKTVKNVLLFFSNKDKNNNYYSSKIINLQADGQVLNENLVHGTPGMRGFFWPYYGTKFAMIKVNDFNIYNAMVGFGLHSFSVSANEGVTPKNAADYGLLYSFHLKYITKDIYKYKCLIFYQKGKHVNLENPDNNDELDEKFYTYNSVSFDLRNYFLLSGINNFNSIYDERLKINLGGITLI